MVFFGIVSREFFQELPVNQNLNAVQSAMYKYTMYSGVFGAQSINIHVFTIFNPPLLLPKKKKYIYNYILSVVGWGWGLKSSAFLILQSHLPLECLLNRNFES